MKNFSIVLLELHWNTTYYSTNQNIFATTIQREVTFLIMSAEKTTLSPEFKRCIVWFYREFGRTGADTHTDMMDVYGDQAPGMATIYRWGDKYGEEWPDLSDEARSGRPRDQELSGRVTEILDELPSPSGRYISNTLQCAKSTVLDILKNILRLKFFTLKWVLTPLSDESEAHTR